MSQNSITAARHPMDILRRRTRATTEGWLGAGFKTSDGLPWRGIRQRLRIDMTPRARSDAGPAGSTVVPSQKLTYTPISIEPFCTPSTGGLGFTWNGELLAEHMRFFRDPYFEISHDETALRLLNAEIDILCDVEGSRIDIYHLPGLSVMISNADPAKATHRRWAHASCHAFYRAPADQHGRLRLSRDLDQAREFLPLCLEATSARLLNWTIDLSALLPSQVTA